MWPKLWRKAELSTGGKWDSSGQRKGFTTSQWCKCVWSSPTQSVWQEHLGITLDSSSLLLLWHQSPKPTGNTFTVPWVIYSLCPHCHFLSSNTLDLISFSHTIATNFSLVCLLLIYLHSKCSYTLMLQLFLPNPKLMCCFPVYSINYQMEFIFLCSQSPASSRLNSLFALAPAPVLSELLCILPKFAS